MSSSSESPVASAVSSSSSSSGSPGERPGKKLKMFLDEASAILALSSRNQFVFPQKGTEISASSARSEPAESAVKEIEFSTPFQERLADSIRIIYHSMHTWFRMCVIDAKKGQGRLIPPVEMFCFPRLFRKSWGYDRLYPDTFHESCPYQTYLQEFNKCNINLDAGLDAYELCLEKEQQLNSEWMAQRINVPQDEIILSNNIKQCCLELNFSERGRLPSATIAATCIAKETELIIERLRHGPSVLDPEEAPNQSTQIRQLALSLMPGEEQVCQSGPDYIVSLAKNAALLGIIKEADLMCGNLRRKYFNSYEMYLNRVIRGFAIELATVELAKLIEFAYKDVEYREFVEYKSNLSAYIDIGEEQNPWRYLDDLDREKSDLAPFAT